MKIPRQWGFIDKSGSLVISPRFDYAQDFEGGTASIVINGLEGLIDRSGTLVVPPNYTAVRRFKEGRAMVIKDDKQGNISGGFLDRRGKLVIPLKFN